MSRGSVISIILTVVHVALATYTVVHALLHKESPRAALGWIASIVIYPIVGPVAYALFGINRVETRSHLLRSTMAGQLDFHRAGRINQGESSAQLAALPEAQRRLLRIGKAITVSPLRGGNQTSLLVNGDQAYPAMLEAIAGAKHRVWLATYIFDTDAAGMRFIDALVAAKERGVDVRVLLDGIGERYSRPRATKLLKAAGVPIGRFLRPRLFPPQLFINLRNHRKLLCIDATIGFAGGMNIGGRHMVDVPETKIPTQDVHFRFEGPVVIDFEKLFLHDWRFVKHSDETWTDPTESQTVEQVSVTPGVTGDLDPGSPPQAVANDTLGSALCRLVPDGPDHDINKLEALFTSLISAADHKLVIVTPYFLPSEPMQAGLIAAALRGVDVTVILPEKCNVRFVQPATYRILRHLLKYDVRVLTQPEPFSHSKLFLIDESYVAVGSANMDPRSLRLNFELGVEVIDPTLAAAIFAHVEAIRQRSTEVTLAHVLARPLVQRLIDGACWLFTPYL